jgi:hypothetical protein
MVAEGNTASPVLLLVRLQDHTLAVRCQVPGLLACHDRFVFLVAFCNYKVLHGYTREGDAEGCLALGRHKGNKSLEKGTREYVIKDLVVRM